MSDHVLDRQDGGGRVTRLTVRVPDLAWAGEQLVVQVVGREVLQRPERLAGACSSFYVSSVGEHVRCDADEHVVTADGRVIHRGSTAGGGRGDTYSWVTTENGVMTR